MGLFDALTTSVGGLQAQSFALQNISGNIANSQTTGFKETDTAFDALVSQAAAGQQTSGSVLAESVATNSVQGSIESSNISTNMAINGDGWFVVAQPTSFSDNQPVFSGVNDYTRRGDFQENSGGYLVNGAGYYLMGIPVSPTTGNPLGSVPQVLQFSTNFVPAQPTTQIQYKANLSSDPATATSSPSVPGSNLLNPVGFTANPLIGAPAAAKVTGTGATILPDADAVGKGSVVLSSGATTTLASLGLTAGQTISVSDGTNTDTYTVPNSGSPTIQNLIDAIGTGSGHTGATAITATINGSNQLVLTGANPQIPITVTGNGASAVGFGTGNTSFQPTNLLTQNIVAAGQTMTVTTDTPPASPTTSTITFGPSNVATLAQLQTALAGLTNVTASVDQTTGNITITANNATDQITIGGSADASRFGIHNLLAIPANGTVIADDAQTFTNESLSGGSVTAYDSTGNPVNIQFRWAKTASVATGGTDTWQLFYQSNSNATGTQSAWTNVGTVFTFNSSGQMSPPLSSLTLANLKVNGDSLGNVQLVFGSNGLTQFADSSGTVQVNELQQDGFAAGKLQSIAVNGQNRIVGTFSNGQNIPLAEITLANFNGEDSLQALNGGAYAATQDSGPALFSATGQIVGNSVEASNVDIATQFSHLIVAQQAYSASAKVMTTANQMMQSLLTVIQ
ncbi:MAG TPA: flagellar hook-basal body complex protein [Xanthobacteraceae bacterium]|nr:flagellar hook-basal body complex protein [Xanthobacteraceae bacterium]